MTDRKAMSSSALRRRRQAIKKQRAELKRELAAIEAEMAERKVCMFPFADAMAQIKAEKGW